MEVPRAILHLGVPLLRLGILVLPLIALADEPRSGVTGLQRDVVFSDYSPLFRSQELVRRLLTPLGAAVFPAREPLAHG